MHKIPAIISMDAYEVTGIMTVMPRLTPWRSSDPHDELLRLTGPDIVITTTAEFADASPDFADIPALGTADRAASLAFFMMAAN